VIATYLLPVKTALVLFPILVLVVMLPVAFVSYRRRGRAGGWTSVVFYFFLFYLLAIALQTVIPLPRNADYCAGHTYASSPQLRPFYFVQVIEEHERGGWGVAAILHNSVLWGTALNVVMLAPLGIFLRYLYRTRLVGTVLIGFGVSFFFELTQLTGMWFVYPCPYRLFSVDDMILNTSGALVGWLLAGPLVRVLPSLAPARERRRYAGQVTVTRRLFALITDALGFGVLLAFGFGLLTLFEQSRQHRGGPILVLAFVWFVLVPAVTRSTPGKRAMLLRIDRADGRRAGPLALLVRYGLLLSPLWLLYLALTLGYRGLDQHPGRLLVLVALGLAVVLVLIWSPLAVVFGERHRAPYERVSGTANAAIVHEAAVAADRSLDPV
jgi:glycopeptide antibiotics resistance protein